MLAIGDFDAVKNSHSLRETVSKYLSFVATIVKLRALPQIEIVSQVCAQQIRQEMRLIRKQHLVNRLATDGLRDYHSGAMCHFPNPWIASLIDLDTI